MDRTVLKTLMAGAATVVLAAVCYLYLDRPAAEAAHALGPHWRQLAKSVSLAADGSLFTAMLAVGFVFAAQDALRNGLTQRTRHLLYLCAAVAAAIFVGEALKELCGRARPPLWFDKGDYGFFPLAGDYLHASFPSGHSLRIFSAMTGLGLVQPALRYPALALAVAVGVARVVALRHYPSDVLFGAFIGVTAALWGWRILYPYGRRAS